MSIQVVTTSLSLARQLFRYGEDHLWREAQTLTPHAVATIGVRAGQIVDNKQLADDWGPGWSANIAVVVAAIECLDGGPPRLPSRRRRKPERQLPPELQASFDERWSDPQLNEVSDAMHALDAAEARPSRSKFWRR